MTLEVNSAPVSCLSRLCRIPAGLGQDLFLEISLKKQFHTHALRAKVSDLENVESEQDASQNT